MFLKNLYEEVICVDSSSIWAPLSCKWCHIPGDTREGDTYRLCYRLVFTEQSNACRPKGTINPWTGFSGGLTTDHGTDHWWEHKILLSLGFLPTKYDLFFTESQGIRDEMDLTWPGCERESIKFTIHFFFERKNRKVNWPTVNNEWWSRPWTGTPWLPVRTPEHCFLYLVPGCPWWAPRRCPPLSLWFPAPHVSGWLPLIFQDDTAVTSPEAAFPPFRATSPQEAVLICLSLSRGTSAQLLYFSLLTGLYLLSPSLACAHLTAGPMPDHLYHSIWCRLGAP